MAAKSQSPSKGHKEQHAPDTVTGKARVATTTNPSHSTLASKESKQPMTDSIPSIIEFSEDIGNAEAPVPLPAGDYPFTIRSAERKTSGAGNEYAALGLFIDPEAYPADYTEGNEDGTLLTYNRMMLTDTPQNRYRIRKVLEAIGAKTGKKLDLNDLIGLNGIAVIAHEMYEGENRPQVKKINAA